ncbi:hypothetical protein ElyMa_000697900 [Elysia marginata]|uniref:Cadherin domain-containing protein n=1 Tax=Elysia marginata TaxID=1093978 RepID=A0AAV4GLB5_9GAST|nr:hypothetical protein ElyMa_000697900 [Elysia marginata]
MPREIASNGEVTYSVTNLDSALTMLTAVYVHGEETVKYTKQIALGNTTAVFDDGHDDQDDDEDDDCGYDNDDNDGDGVNENEYRDHDYHDVDVNDNNHYKIVIVTIIIYDL